MISAFTQIILVIATLVAMIVILFGVRRLSNLHHEDYQKELSDFREEIRKNHNVMGEHNSFREFLAREDVDKSKADTSKI